MAENPGESRGYSANFATTTSKIAGTISRPKTRHAGACRHPRLSKSANVECALARYL